MQSNFSHMSEAEEFSRMSELAEVSDEDDYDNGYDDIPEEASDLEPSEDVESWPEVDFKGTEQAEPSADQNATKAKSKPYVNPQILTFRKNISPSKNIVVDWKAKMFPIKFGNIF